MYWVRDVTFIMSPLICQGHKFISLVYSKTSGPFSPNRNIPDGNSWNIPSPGNLHSLLHCLAVLTSPHRPLQQLQLKTIGVIPFSFLLLQLCLKIRSSEMVIGYFNTFNTIWWEIFYAGMRDVGPLCNWCE